MRRFFSEEIDSDNGTCIIPENEARHMVKVLRMKEGDRFILMDSKGRHFESVIEDCSRHKLIARIISELPAPKESPLTINICQAMLKSRKMDYMIEKTSELGVANIQPFYSERTVLRLDDKKASNKIRHWKEITRSASKQSGRSVPAEISDPASFDDLLSFVKAINGLKVVLWENEDVSDLKEFIRSNGLSNFFTGIIGPEGGFSNREIDKLRDCGVVPVSMGSRILRAETASIALSAIIQYEWGDLGI